MPYTEPLTELSPNGFRRPARPSSIRTLLLRRLPVVAVAAVSVFALSACGAGSNVGGSSTAGGTSGGAKAANVKCDIAQPTSPTTVNILAYNSVATDPFTNVLTANCKSKDLTLNHPATDLVGQKQRAVQTLSGSSASYDLIEQFGTVFPLYAARGWTVPIDDYMTKYKDKFDLGAIDPSLLKAAEYDGKLYGLPTYWSVNQMVYRKDIFDKLGLKPPTTFAEMIDDAKIIQDKGGIKYPLAVPMAPTNDIQGLFGQTIRSLGGDYFVPGEPKPALNTPDGVEAVNAIRSLLPYMAPQALSFSSPEVTTQLLTGQAAMGMLVTGRLSPLVDKTKSPNADKFGFATPPSVKAGGKPLSFLSVDGFALAKNSKVDKDLLFQLAAVATGNDAAKAALPIALPARLDVLKGASIPFADSALAILKDAKPLPLTPVPYMADVYSVLGAPIGEAVSGKVPVQQALDNAQSVATKAIQSAGFAK
ncbi:MAG: sugar ABC transporter substrate-binding protein [Mycobacteriaceae bacterium]